MTRRLAPRVIGLAIGFAIYDGPAGEWDRLGGAVTMAVLVLISTAVGDWWERRKHGVGYDRGARGVPVIQHPPSVRYEPPEWSR